MNHMDYIEINNKVTLKSLKINRTPEIIGSVIQRFTDVYEMVENYITKDMTIMDMGIKDGLLFDIFVNLNFDKEKLIGIDCCPEVVQMCEKKGYLVYEADIQNISMYKDNEFDFIFLIHTLEHIPEPEKVISECIRLLRPNGYVFVEVPIQSQIDEPEKWGHYHPFTSQDQVKDLFNKNFDVIKEDWQKTKSKSPWFRILFQLKEKENEN